MEDPPLPGTCCADGSGEDGSGDDGPATVWLGPGGRAAYLGPALDLGDHSGSVACVVLGVDAPFRLRAGGVDLVARSALVAPRTRHRLVAGPGRTAFAYLDPSSADLPRLRARMTAGGGAVSWDHADEAELLDRVRGGGTDPGAVVAGGPPRPVDPRVGRAMAAVRARPADRTGAAQVAAAVGLSPSRFLHVFSAEAGTSFRRYRTWARMAHVARAVSRGSDLTTAAMDAGYASPSHFSDTFRATFGLSTTALLARPTRFVVADELTPAAPGGAGAHG